MPSNIMNLSDVLKSLDESDDSATEKTASDSSSKSDVKNELVKILMRGNDSGETTEKVASEGPAQDLEKIASDIAEAEEEALVKQAQLYGAAVCDGFMARMSQYEEAAGHIQERQPSVKTASRRPSILDREVEETEEVTTTKLAQEVFEDIDDEAVEMAEQLVKEAEENGEDLDMDTALVKVAEHYHGVGFQETMEKAAEAAYEVAYEETMEKAAEALYETGYDDIMEKAAEAVQELGFEDTIEKVAEDFYNQGFEDTLEKAAEALQEEGYEEAVEEMTKVAFECGYEDAMEKIASAAYDQGFNDMQMLIDSVAA